MSTHSHLTRRHLPPDARRRRRVWAPTALVGALLFAVAPHPDIAGVYAFTALLGVVCCIADREES